MYKGGQKKNDFINSGIENINFDYFIMDLTNKN